VVGALEPLLGQSTVREGPTRQRARGYYQAGAIRIGVERNSQLVEIGDGGFTDWTAKLMADNKERCLISSIATERVTALATRNT
jgi:hypothetical protein